MHFLEKGVDSYQWWEEIDRRNLMADSLSGRTIRDYVIHEIIGQGGYGTVYRALQQSVNREVAIKVILPKHANDPEFVRRFKDEAQLVARLEHPHIVPLYEYWTDAQDGAFIVMRYLRGDNLRKMIDKHGALSIAQIVRIIQQIADGLSVAHGEGVVHRDIKPDNILIDERDNVYVTDFGVAKTLTGQNDLTETGAFVGTPAYLSPEQIEGREVSTRSDIYSLGIVLYEMLTGEHPFNTHGLMIVMQHLQELVPSVLIKRPDVPSEMDAVLQRATAKDPAHRFPTMEAFAQALKAGANLYTPTTTERRLVVQGTTLISREGLPPLTTADRNRRSMLQNVHTFWIEGLLENSLHGMSMLELDLQQKAGAVDNPWDVLLRQPGLRDETLDQGVSVISSFDRLNGKLLILGDPGSGKTTTLLELTRDLLYRAGLDEEHAIPAVFNLSSWSENAKALDEWLVDELGNKYLVPRQVAQKWVDDDQLLLLLDGLDEVTQDKRDACVSAINTFRETHGFVDVVVCSRTIDYEALTEQLKLNGAISIQPLTYEQVNAYLDTFGDDMNAVRAMLKTDGTLWEMSRHPLMLSILTLAYTGMDAERLAEFDNLAEGRRNLFDVYVQRMFERRIASKQLMPDLSREKMTGYLRWLATKMQTHAQSLFQIEDLQPTWLTDAQKKRYFTHFTLFHVISQAIAWSSARLLLSPTGIVGTGIVNGVAWAVAGAVWGWVLSTDLWRKWWAVILSGTVFGVAVGIDAIIVDGMEAIAQIPIGAVLYTLLIVGGVFQMRRSNYSRETVQPAERLRFSRDAVKVWMVVLSGILGMMATFINGTAAGLETFETAPTLLGMAMGLIAGGFTGFLTSGFASDQVGKTTRPNQGIFQSGRHFLQMGGIIGVMFIVIITTSVFPLTSLRFGLTQGVIAAIPFGYNVGLYYGGLPLSQHLIIRRILWRDGSIPVNLAQFLNSASALILLRKVGGGYIFIHRYLLDYFAQTDTTQQSSRHSTNEGEHV